MKQFLPLATILFSLLYSACAQHTGPAALKAVKMDLHWEHYLTLHAVDSSDRSIYLVFNNEYQVFMDPYRKWESEEVMEKGKLVLKRKFLGIAYDYFICKKGSAFGLAYTSLSAKKGIPFAVDSMIQDNLKTPAIAYFLRNARNDTLVTVIKDEKNDMVIEKITNTKNPTARNQDEFAQDSSYFYYRSKPMGVSFFNKSERFKDMYLYKCRVIFNDRSIIRDSVTFHLKKWKWIFEMKEVEVPDKEKILALIEQFKKESSTEKHKRP